MVDQEPPITVETREELVYLLSEASEIEHGLMCEYLYAQFSLKQSTDEGLTPEQLIWVRSWQATMVDIIKQEMLHLALASNLLGAVGAAPHFDRPNFPVSSRWYPHGVRLLLAPFGEPALRHFMYLERPEGIPLDDDAGQAALSHAEPMMASGGSLTPGPQDWHTVGHLYRGIEAGLEQLAARYGEQEVFIGPPGAQATTPIFEWTELVAVTDLASARAAVDVIVEQGEGARGNWVASHFGRFAGMLEDFLVQRAADPFFDPARPVEPAYVTLLPDVDADIVIDDPRTGRVADLFSALYETVLQVITRYFVHHGETPAELDTLATTAKHLMNRVMRALGPVLTSCPIGSAANGRSAGPTFEIVRPGYHVLPHRRAAWKVIHERLLALTGACDVLAADAELAALSGPADELRAMAAEVGTRISERSGGGDPIGQPPLV